MNRLIQPQTNTKIGSSGFVGIALLSVAAVSLIAGVAAWELGRVKNQEKETQKVVAQNMSAENFSVGNLGGVQPSVLAEAETKYQRFFEVNVPAIFHGDVETKNTTIGGTLTLEGSVTGKNVDVNIGTGKITAGNVVYSLQGKSGDVKLEAGEGIAIDGLKISNTNPGLTQKSFGVIKNADGTINASKKSDTLTFAGDGRVTVSTDAKSKTITIASGDVTLGTDTSGDYVKNLSAGTGVQVSATSGEGSAPTVSLYHLGLQDLSAPASDKIYYYDSVTGKSQWLAVGTGLSISGNTLSATASSNYSAGGNLLQLVGTTFSLKEGTLTNNKVCTYSSTTGINCNTDLGAAGASYTAGLGLVLSSSEFSLDESASLSGDHNLSANQEKFGAGGIIFEGSTQDSYETYITVTDATGSDKTIIFPNNSGTVVLTSDLANYVPTTRTVNGHALSGDITVTKGDLGLGNVEDTALSTWSGSANISTVGTISTGTWNGTLIATNKGGTGLSAFNQFGIFYAPTTSTMGQLPAGTAGQVLTSNGAGSAPTWQASSGSISGSGTTGFATYWTGTNSIGAEQYLSVSRGGTGAGTLTGIIVGNGSSAFTTITNNSTNWDAAASHKTTEDAINGLVKVNGAGGYSAVTDNSSNWNTAYTYRLTSASGTAPVTASLVANALTVSIANSAADGSTKGAAAFASADFNDNGSGVISLDYTNGQAANGTTKGFLTSGDWTIFNNKQAALTIGNLTTGSNLSVTGGTGAVIGAGAQISLGSNVVTGVTNGTNVTGSISSNTITLGWTGQLGVPGGGTGIATTTPYAILTGGTTATGAFQQVTNLGTTGQVLTSNGNGALPTWQSLPNDMVFPGAGIAVSTGSAWGTSITDSSSNWNTAYTYRLTSASGTAPLTLSLSNNALTGSITQASGSTNGYLSSTDWSTFNNKQAALTGAISGTSNQVSVSANSNSVASNITLSLPQDIATASTPTFGGMTLNGNLNVKNGTYKTTISNSGSQTVDIAYVLPSAAGGAGEVLKTDASGNLYWATIAGGSGGIGTVTSVGSGNGLTGGPITTSGTLNVAVLNAETASTATTSSYSGLEFVGANNQLSLLHGCSANDVLSWDNTAKKWQCSSVSGIGGLTGSGTTNYNAYWTASNTLGAEQYVAVSRGGTGAGSLTGLVVGNGTSAFTTTPNNSTNWDAGYTYRLTSASGTSPLTLTLSSNGLTGSISDASADGSTKGISTYAANDFNATLGVVSIDYTNGQAASGSTKGFLTAADWTTFNSKEGAISAGTTAQYYRGDKSWQTLDKTAVGLGNVENTALSTWAGTTNVTTLGTITTGTWNGSVVDVAHGGTNNSSLTAYAILTGGTTSTGSLQQVSGVGTAGQALLSNGAGALPTWQSLPNDMVFPGAGIAVSTGSAWGTSITDSSSNWNAAYSHKTTEDAINGLVFVNGAGSYSAKAIGTDIQAYDAELAGLAGLTYASGTPFIKMTAAGTFTLDTNTYEGSIAAGTTAQYYRGDKSWQTLNQAAVAGLTTGDAPTFAGVNLTKGSAPTADIAVISNSGYGTVTNGVDGLSIDFTSTADSGADTNSGLNIAYTPSGESGDTGRGINIATSGIAAGTLYGINIAGITPDAGTEKALVIGAGWDTAIDAGSGAILGGTYNKVTITQPTNGATLTLADGKTFTVNNSLTLSGADSKTINFGSNSITFTTSGDSTLTLPTSGTVATGTGTANYLAYWSGTNALSAITPVNSGVVVTNGSGVPSVATDIPTAVTIGSGYIYRVGGTDVSLADGGSGASLTASNGGIVYSTGSAMAILSGTATANKVLLSGSSTTPSWSTATFPATAGTAGTIMRADGTNWVATSATYPTITTANQLLYSSATNTVSGLTSANSSVLVTNASGVPSLGTDLPTAITIGGGYVYRVGGTDVSLADGGTGASLSAVNGGVVYSTGSAMAMTAAGTSGQLLQSSGAGAPAWTTATFPGTAGTSGTMLTSNGTNWINTTATYPATATSTGSILRADGTNWTGSTATYPNTVTANQIMYATATNTLGGGTGLTYDGNTLKASGTAAEQLRLAYSDTAYATFTVNSLGNLNITPSSGGGVVLATGSGDPNMLSDSGKMVLGGNGNTNNEKIMLDFETTANKVLVTTSTGVTTIDLAAIGMTTTGTVTAGQIIDSGLSVSSPVFTDSNSQLTSTGTVGVANGGTGASSLTAYAVLTGGTTSTGAMQQVSGLGTSGYVLTSNGAGALPTWQASTGVGGSGAANQVAYWSSSSAVTGSTGFTYDDTNKAMGLNTLRAIAVKGSTGSENLFLGQSGNFTTTGTNNIFAGYQAGAGVVMGNDNIALGYQALTANAYGRYNVAIGTSALATQSYNPGGYAFDSANIAIGYQSLYNNQPTSTSNGMYNIGIGHQAMTGNTTGSNNIALGYESLYYNNTGRDNVAIGSQNLFRTTSNNNTAIGSNAGLNNKDAADNTFIGYSAGYSNGYGAKNVAVGSGALFTQSYANGNSAWDTGNVAVGYRALYSNQPTSATNGWNNIAMGQYAGYTNSTGNENVFLGYKAGYLNTTGSNNIFLGGSATASQQAGYNNTTGSNNFLAGYGAGYSNTTGTDFIALGYQAGYYFNRADAANLSNIFMGYQAGRGANGTSTGQYNLFQGYQTGYSNTSASYGIFQGYQAGYSNTSGGRNIFLGLQAGYQNTTGDYNIYIGQQTGLRMGSGAGNIFLGDNAGAGLDNSSGSYNIFMGHYAGFKNASAQENIFMGFNAGYWNSYAQKNIAIGSNALYSQNYANTNAVWDAHNVAIGYNALTNNVSTSSTNGYLNVALGGYSLQANTIGARNVAIGSGNTTAATQAPLYANVAASDNIAIGNAALRANTYAEKNVAIGTGALYTQSYANTNAVWDSQNVAIGYQSLYSNQPTSTSNGYQNTAVGYQAGYGNTIGYGNAFLGNSAGYSNTTGNYNTFLGYQAGVWNSQGTFNTFVGSSAGNSTKTAGDNTALGYNALASNTYGQKNLALGSGALQTQSYTNGNSAWDTSNVAVGYQSLYSNQPTDTVTGYQNTAVGYQSLYTNSTGVKNTALGYYSGKLNTTGGFNTFLGYQAGYGNNTGAYNVNVGQETSYYNQSGQYNVSLGYQAGFGASSNSYSQDVFVGYQSGMQVTTGSSNVFLGYKAGYNQTTNSNLLIVDNQDRSSAANELTKSLIYGVFNSSPANQTLALNAGSVSFGSDTAGGATNVPGSLKLFSNGDNAYYTSFTAGTQSANATYTLPTAMPGSNKLLQSDSSGVLTWVSAGAGVSFGTTTQIPYMNAGGTDFLYGAGLTFDGTNLTVSNSNTTGANLSVTNTGIYTGTGIANLTANSLTTGVGQTISTTGATSGSSLKVTGGGANMLTGGEAIDVVLGANTVGAGMTITSTGAYTGVGAADGLVNITANSLTSGYAFQIPHTTSVISTTGSLMRLSSSSVDTGTAGTLLSLASTGSTAGTISMITNNTASFTGISQAISMTGQTTGTGLSITGGGANLAAGGELIDLQMGAATAGNGINIVNSGAYTGTGLVNVTANSLTTGDVLALSATAMTTGSMITATGPSSTGVTDHFVKLTSDVGSGTALIYGAPDFSGSGVTGYGLNITATDATSSANTDYGVYSSLALTGNAAKTATGLYSTLSTSSTTADTLVGADLATSTTGIITTGTRNIYGLRSQPASTAASTGGTTNVYGGYLKSGGTVGAGGTINSYGLYVANGTMNTTGTSSNVGLYVEAPTGADTNYGAIFAGGNVGISNTAPGALLDIGTAGSTLGTLRLEGNTSGYVQIQSAAAAGSWTMTLPTSGGTNGYFLQTNGSGTTTWAAAASGSGTAGQVAYWTGSPASLTSAAGFTYDGNTLGLTSTTAAQLKLSYDASNYATMTADSTGGVTLATATGTTGGDISFAPAGSGDPALVSDTGKLVFGGSSLTNNENLALDFETTSNAVAITSSTGVTTIAWDSADLGNGVAGKILVIGNNTNATNAGAGSINFVAKSGTNGYVWQDAAGNMRVNTAAPTTANDTAGTVIGAQTSTRETKQDISDFTDYAGALNMISGAPLHYFRYTKEVDGYGTTNPLAKYRLGFIADEVPEIFMWDKTIDQVSINGLLIGSIKGLKIDSDELRQKVETAAVNNVFTEEVVTEESPVVNPDGTVASASTTRLIKTLNGNLAVTGTLTVRDDANFIGKTVFNNQTEFIGDAKYAGLVTFNGKTNFAGTANFSGLTTFLADAIFQGKVSYLGEATYNAAVKYLGDVEFTGTTKLGDTEFVGRPMFNADTAGMTLIKKGVDQIDVVFAKEYAEQPVVNIALVVKYDNKDNLKDDELKTAQENYEKAVLAAKYGYIVTRQDTKGFRILLNKKAEQDVMFSWVALAVKDMKTSVSKDAEPADSGTQNTDNSNDSGSGTGSNNNDNNGSTDSGANASGGSVPEQPVVPPVDGGANPPAGDNPAPAGDTGTQDNGSTGGTTTGQGGADQQPAPAGDSGSGSGDVVPTVGQ